MLLTTTNIVCPSLKSAYTNPFLYIIVLASIDVETLDAITAIYSPAANALLGIVRRIKKTTTIKHLAFMTSPISISDASYKNPYFQSTSKCLT